MLAENMMMAFNAIRANKLRSVLTMLGIIIGIGSVIAIVSIGDTMRGMFAELYKDVGITQAYVGIGYWCFPNKKILRNSPCLPACKQKNIATRLRDTT